MHTEIFRYYIFSREEVIKAFMNRKNIKTAAAVTAAVIITALFAVTAFASPYTAPFETPAGNGRSTTDTNIGNGYGSNYGINGNNNTPAANGGGREYDTTDRAERDSGNDIGDDSVDNGAYSDTDNNSIIGEINGDDRTGDEYPANGRSRRAADDALIGEAENDGTMEENGGVIGIAVAIIIAVAVIVLIIALIPKSTSM